MSFKTLDDMLIDTATIESIKHAISGTNFKLLFYGTSGVGKTTLAYLIASYKSLNVIETNMSDERTIDDLKKLERRINNKPLFGNGNLFLFDEIDGIRDQKFFNKLKDIIESSIHPIILTCNRIWVIPSSLKKVVTSIEIKPSRSKLRHEFGFNADNTDIRALKLMKDTGSEGYAQQNSFRNIELFFDRRVPASEKSKILNMRNIDIWLLENIPEFSWGRQLYENYRVLAISDLTKRREVLSLVRANKRGTPKFPNLLMKRKVI